MQSTRNPLIETCRTINQAGFWFMPDLSLVWWRKDRCWRETQLCGRNQYSSTDAEGFYKHCLIQLCGKIKERLLEGVSGVGRSKFYNEFLTYTTVEWSLKSMLQQFGQCRTSQLSKTLFSTMSEYHSNPIFSRICTFRQVKAKTCGSSYSGSKVVLRRFEVNLATALGNLRTKPQFLNMYLGLCAAGAFLGVPRI